MSRRARFETDDDETVEEDGEAVNSQLASNQDDAGAPASTSAEVMQLSDDDAETSRTQREVNRKTSVPTALDVLSPASVEDDDEGIEEQPNDNVDVDIDDFIKLLNVYANRDVANPIELLQESRQMFKNLSNSLKTTISCASSTLHRLVTEHDEIYADPRTLTALNQMKEWIRKLNEAQSKEKLCTELIKLVNEVQSADMFNDQYQDLRKRFVDGIQKPTEHEAFKRIGRLIAEKKHPNMLPSDAYKAEFGNADGNDDEELHFVGQEVIVTDPVTQKEMVDPVKSRKCGHRCDRSGLEQLFQQLCTRLHHPWERRNEVTGRCPTAGCSVVQHYNDWQDDVEMKEFLKKRREQMAKDGATQAKSATNGAAAGPSNAAFVEDVED